MENVLIKEKNISFFFFIWNLEIPGSTFYIGK